MLKSVLNSTEWWTLVWYLLESICNSIYCICSSNTCIISYIETLDSKIAWIHCLDVDINLVGHISVWAYMKVEVELLCYLCLCNIDIKCTICIVCNRSIVLCVTNLVSSKKFSLCKLISMSLCNNGWIIIINTVISTCHSLISLAIYFYFCTICNKTLKII